MNKEVKLSKNTITLFMCNIFVLFSMFGFKYYYTYKMYEKKIISVFLIINIVIFLLAVAYNLFMLLSQKDNKKRDLIFIVFYLVFYLLLNTMVIYIINKPISDGYKKNSLVLSKYCETYNCENFYNETHDAYRDFVIKNRYFDYNNDEKDIQIRIKYNHKNIISVKAIIYSNSSSFSEKNIKEQIDKYFLYFNKDIKEALIRKAFDSRFNGKIIDNGITYKVSEIYEKGKLVSLKTEISFKVK